MRDNHYPFRLNVDKAVQAAGVILREERDGCMNYMKLLKLLYIAERRMLGKVGLMITGDRVSALERGPVLSGVYDLIKGEHAGVEHWDEYIEKQDYNVKLKAGPGVEKLSRMEIETLQEVASEYRLLDEWEMVKVVHELDEWKRNDPGTSSKPIPLQHILEAIGLGDRADGVIQEASQQAAFDDFFVRHSC